MSTVDQTILERVAQGLKRPDDHDSADAGAEAPESAPSGPLASSILLQAAAVYGKKPDQPEATPGTGFDPAAAALFEALVEGAFLVAHADGVVDAEELAAFRQVVTSASGSRVNPAQIAALLADLEEALTEDGVERRTTIVASAVSKPEHRGEVLRVAALVAQVSGGVSEPEREVMEGLARALGLEPADVDRAVEAAQAVLA